ncbi:hypothetical protein VO226_15580 [Halomonas elongata]|uniref:hypothetical protein n=1 Tax=Halomonas elongata TaxID=2746 RepID=UPI002E2955E5|nr:hypothetical protein [Halomonas elongata]WVI71324.1 hypothetical protein VO226_15580 [Halomonas elongata]
MTLKERLKQLKAGADRQAAELGHENAAGAAVAFGRVTGRALGNVVHDAGKLALAFVPDDDGQDTPSKRVDKNSPLSFPYLMLPNFLLPLYQPFLQLV